LNTRNKLEEAHYFSRRLKETKDDPKIYYYYLSAFLTAWRSVLDVMLYDFAEHYPLRLDRKVFIDNYIFWVAANAINHTEALNFIVWWNEKADIVRKNELSKMRITSVHKGFPPRTVYAPPTLSSGSIIFATSGVIAGSSGDFRIATPTAVYHPISPSDIFEISEVIKKCEEGYKLIESIVIEAEKRFSVKQ
jgi:hypothetical protein